MKRTIAILFVFILTITILPAASIADGNSGSPFSVVVIIPENNIGDVGYYHVPGEPGEKITLKAKLNNLTEEPLEIKAVPLNAYSGDKGIFYQPADRVNSEIYSLVDEKYGVAQYITVIDSITLQPKQTTEVEIYVTVPDIRKGTLLGSIQFILFEGTQELDVDGRSNGTSILIDKYKAVDTAIQIDLPEKDQTLITVGEPDFIEETNSLTVTFSNEAAIIEKNISGTYQIKDRQNNVVLEGNIDTFKMAPMTRFKYLIPWGDKPFEQGAYTLYFQIDANGRKMNFEIPLVIEHKPEPSGGGNTPSNTDNQQNPQTDDSVQNPIRPYLLIGLAGILIFFGLLIFLSYRKGRKEKR